MHFGHQDLHAMLGYAPGEMPLGELMERNSDLLEVVRDFNRPPDKKDGGTQYVMKNGVLVPKE